MLDSTNASDIPTDAEMAAGYVNGKWPSYKAIVARCPNAEVVSIAVTASADADVLDIETGDATPAQAPAWVDRQLARGYARPTLYCEKSAWPAVKQAVGNRPVDYWVADYLNSGEAHSLPGAVAVQYRDTGMHGEHYDMSLVTDDGWPHRTGDDMTPEQEQLLKDCQSILSQLKGAAGDPVQTIREIAQEVVSANFRWWAGPVDGNGGQLLLDIKAKVNAGGGDAPVPRSGTWTTS